METEFSLQQGSIGAPVYPPKRQPSQARILIHEAHKANQNLLDRPAGVPRPELGGWTVVTLH